MRRNEIVMGLGTICLLLLLIAGCGGGGGGGGNGGNGGTSVTATITGAAYVAVQDGANGEWQRLTASGDNYNFRVTSADGRYSVAWVCEGEKPQVNIVHATTAETTSFGAACPASPNTITVAGTVQGLRSGEFALVSISSASQTVGANGDSFNLSLTLGTYDLIGVRTGGAGPNRVWLRRSVSFAGNSSGLVIDFNQPDGAVVRVFDVQAGSLTVDGVDFPNETATSQIALQSSNRSSLIGVGVSASLVSPPVRYPVFPSGILQAGESFRVQVITDRQRGEVQGLGTLPNSLTITVPPPFDSPQFDFTTSGDLTFTAQWSAYAESPVRGYVFTLGGSQQARSWRIFISAGWLGGRTSYTTPVLNGLPGWNSSAWDIQRGRAVDASFTAFVSQNTLQEILNYERTGIAPAGFRLRFATRSATLTP